MLNQSVSYYLGEYWSQQPLYSQKIIPLLEYFLANTESGEDSLPSLFFELINKYQNPQDLPYESMKALIEESGYSYIVDLLNPSIEDLKVILYLLVLIHLLKGSKKGLETVLSIFSTDSQPDDIQIVQWFEELPVMEDDTFRIESKLDISKVDRNFFVNFNNFIRNYVYPTLKELKVKFTLNATTIIIPVSQVEIKYTSYGEV